MIKDGLSNISLKLAQKAYEDGKYEETLNFLENCLNDSSAVSLKVIASYKLGCQLLQIGKREVARKRFIYVAETTSDELLKDLCRKRVGLLNKQTYLKSIGFEASEFGRSCTGCNEERTLYHCGRCSKYGEPILESERIKVTDLRPNINEVYCAAAYKSGYDPGARNPFSRAIRLIKRGEGRLLVDILGLMLADYVIKHTKILANVDFIVPVPTDPERRKVRGYGIPDVLADGLEKKLALPVIQQVLELTRQSPELRQLPRWQRASAVTGLYDVIKPDLVKGRSVLIVDDVITTGSTLQEIGKQLKASGTNKVYGIALAHTEASFIYG